MTHNSIPTVPRWGRFEHTFTSAVAYNNPLQDAQLRVTFSAPSGQRHVVQGFWDGGAIWRVRFAPDELGDWLFASSCSDAANGGLHGVEGAFTCGASEGDTRFAQHGPVRVSADGHALEHADGTPFLWLADTAWNGPLRADDAEWNWYVAERVRQGFSAVQWVTTQWIAAPDGDREGQVAYSGRERIAVDPAFFARLDLRLDALNRAGLLGAPVLLWAARWGNDEAMQINPGLALPDEQAALLASYMVARWGAHQVLWIINGDGNYNDERAARWQQIGQAVFGQGAPAPVAVHICGQTWLDDALRNEPWLDIIGYQSGHGDSLDTWRWLNNGPPSSDWRRAPTRVLINLEPPYENHLAYHSRQPHSAFSVRRALYWSLLAAPVAGVTYGGHGVWGWDDGSAPPVGHPTTGTPQPWRVAVRLPAAEQLIHLARLFDGLPWRQLLPAPELLAAQPGVQNAERFIAAARSEAGDLALVYLPEDQSVTLQPGVLQAGLSAHWYDPRNGTRVPAAASPNTDELQFETPGAGDWVLLLSTAQ